MTNRQTDLHKKKKKNRSKQKLLKVQTNFLGVWKVSLIFIKDFDVMCFGFFPPHPDLAIFQKLLNFCLLSAL